MTARRRTRRLHCPHLSPGRVVLSGGEAHHALHVLRLGAGDAVELFDGRGAVAQAVLVEVGRGEAVAEADRVERVERPAARVHVGFAVPKGKRLDWLLEKATELAAASLTPVRFARSVAEAAAPGSRKGERWEAHCITAAKQSGLSHLPELRAALDMEAFCRAVGAAEARLLGDDGPDAVAPAAALDDFAGGEVAVLVGPEGGLTDDERSRALSAGFVPARIGPGTLRVETAVAALLAGVWASPRVAERL